MSKETTTKTIIYVLLGALILVSWGIAFGFIKRDVHYVGQKAANNTAEIKVLDEKYNDFGKTVTRIDTRQEVMIKSLDEIKEKIK